MRQIAYRWILEAPIGNVYQWLAVVATTLTLFEAGPPMPAHMLKAEDADAIAAYLKSLP